MAAYREAAAEFSAPNEDREIEPPSGRRGRTTKTIALE
jgi:hypothetical protein